MSIKNDGFLVKGEAIESDDEEDLNSISEKSIDNIRIDNESSQGIVFTGEAPESDDEVLTFSNVTLPATLAQEVTEIYAPSPTPSMQNSQINVEKSVLQKILVDRNHSLWNHLNSFMQSTVVTASSQIIAAEQLLVQSQVRLQVASRTIKQANETAEQILINCRNILSDNFLPDIKVPS